MASSPRASVCLLAMFAACGGAAAAPTRPVPSGPPVGIETVMVGERPILVVDARVNDVPARMWIDSGAGAHIIERGAMTKTHLSVVGSTSLSTIAGVRVGQQTSAAAVLVSPALQTAAEPLTVDYDPYREHAFDGLVSPQSLVPRTDAVELDIRGGTLTHFSGDAIRAERTALALRGTRTDACRSSAHAVQTVYARLGNDVVTLLVDTGAPATLLFDDTVAGAHAVPAATERRVFGGLLVSVVPRYPMRVGGMDLHVRVLVGRRPGEICDADGIVGLDVLRACTLLMSEEGGALACTGPLDEDGAMARYLAHSRLAPELVALAGVTDMTPFVDGPLDELRPVPSPDGRRLLFDAAVPNERTTRRHLELVDVATPSRRAHLTPDADASTSGAVWTADGDVIFREYLEGRLRLMRGTPPEAVSPTVVLPSDRDAPLFRPAAVLADGRLLGDARIREASHVVIVDGDRVTDFFAGADPALAPDGAHVAFIRSVDGVGQVEVAALDGTPPVALTTDDFEAQEPTYSADGRWIFFVAARSTRADRVNDRVGNLFAVSTDGARLVELTDGDSEVSRPRSAPDGWVYFSSNAQGNVDVWRLRFDGTGLPVTHATGGVRVRLTVEQATGIAGVQVGAQTELTISLRGTREVPRCYAHVVLGGHTVYGRSPDHGRFPCANFGSPTPITGRDDAPSSRDGDAAFWIDTFRGYFTIEDDAGGPLGAFRISGTARVE